MLKKLQHAQLEILAVLVFHQSVPLFVVVQHPGRFTQTAQCHVKLNPLIPGYGTVFVVVHDQQRSIHLVDEEDGRVLQVTQWFFPQRASNPALGMFVLEHPAHASFPANATVGRNHVDYRRTRLGAFKNVGLGDQIGNLVATPTVALYPQIVFVHKPLVHQGRNPGNDCIVCTLARIANAVRNIRNEHQKATTGQLWKTEYGTVIRRCPVLVQ